MSAARAVVATGAAALVLAAAPWLLSDFLLSLTVACLMYAGLAVSWAMFSGPTHYLSLATAAFFGLGAYVTAWGVATLPWALCVAGGGLVAAVFAALVGAAVLHLRGAYFAVLTFGLGELVRHAITYFEKSYFRTVGRVLTKTPDATTVYLTVLGVAAAAVAVAAVVRASRLGLALRGIGGDEERAQTLGVSTRRMKIAGFALSAFFAGAMGAAVAVRWTYIDPPAVFNPFIGLQTVLIAMVGGAATLGGPLASAVVFSLFTEFLRLRFPYAFLLVLGTLLIVLVLYLPGGLASLVERRRPAAAAGGAARGAGGPTRG
ncbi:MAG TPA: branched-chain amino acid ABC transporter permease [Candidatus Acidoferrum sp.]|nr:branched-chain amino acid ABC transporter permease [Candidatus Acidoferrum sp.]